MKRTLDLASSLPKNSTMGSILHGAYGDYYEQMVCLRYLREQRPDLRLVIFFATEARRRELAVFDLSFADAVYPASEVETTDVDRFFQFQVRDEELNADILSRLSPRVLSRFDLKTNLKPWSILPEIWSARRDLCDIPLSELGQQRLPECFRENSVDPEVFNRGFTVGFLWRYRGAGGPVSNRWQVPEATVLRTKSELLTRLADVYGARILVAGMSVRVTEENRERTDRKFTENRLSVPESACVYLKGLSWGLELEVMRRCSLCLVMPSGFSEALVMKRTNPTLLVDPAPHFIAKLLWNRVPFFDAFRPRQLAFYLRQPHTADRVLAHLDRNAMLPMEAMR